MTQNRGNADITARVIEDSISPDGIRLTTILLRYPRFIHAEFMTHRVFSRNGRSSRAVPVKRLLLEDTVTPWAWGANRPGMASDTLLNGWRYALAKATWLGLAAVNRAGVRVLHFAGLHKQWANRPLEWFGSIDVLVTSTDWANFYALRLDGGAQPEIRVLARRMHTAMARSTPKPLKPGEWHLPFISEDERSAAIGAPIEALKVMSVARCARLTIEPFDGDGDLRSEQRRYDALLTARPVHASPAEHQATPDHKSGIDDEWYAPDWHGNFRGWRQLRRMIPHESVKD